LWTLGAEIFCTLEIKETHFLSEFQDPNPKNGAWRDNRRNKKIRIFSKKGHISNQFTGQSTKRMYIMSIAFC